MFEASNKREASITLCLFPHLGEFIAVDARKSIPDGPAVHVISFESIFTNEFRGNLEADFSSLLRKENPGLMDMIGLPQEVETIVRAESMKRVLKNLNHAAGTPDAGVDGGIGVLFFARELLSIHQEQLQSAMQDLFGEVLSDTQLARLQTELNRLITAERAAEDQIRNREMAQLIKGTPGQFLTLWQSDSSN
jgi:hypothetical protein